MMAALFALFSFAIFSVLGGQRALAIGLILLTLLLCLLMFLHHATSILNINL